MKRVKSFLKSWEFFLICLLVLICVIFDMKDASDLVAEAALGVANGLTLEQVAHTIHAHPTLAEGLYEAALLAQEA